MAVSLMPQPPASTDLKNVLDIALLKTWSGHNLCEEQEDIYGKCALHTLDASERSHVSVLILISCLHVQAPITQQHYAVDMFLAVVVTSLVWMQLDCLCPDRYRLPQRQPAYPPDRRGPLQWLFTLLIFAVLMSLIIIIIGGGA